MNVTGILFLVLVIHGNVTFSWMPIVDDAAEILKHTTDSTIGNNATTSAPPVNCKTAKTIEGLCVLRDRCDFGSGSTDFTLYAPRWYKKPCKADEVCCPYQYIMVQSQPEPSNPLDDNFDLDVDEY